MQKTKSNARELWWGSLELKNPVDYGNGAEEAQFGSTYIHSGSRTGV
jgi:hypothetical protein